MTCCNPKTRCCCCIPRNVGVKLFILWPLMAIFLNTMTAFSYGGTGAVSFIPILYTILVAYLIMGWAFFVPGKDTKTARLAAFLAFFLGITLAWNIYYWFLMFAGWGEDDKLMNWKCPADFRAAEM